MTLWFQIIASAAGYFLYNWQFFRCTESALEVPPLRRRSLVWTFLVNYGAFYLCSVWGLHLIVNWIIFLFLLLGEQVLLYRKPAIKCFLLALWGTQLGLAANILLRSLIAVLLDVPLVFFDNNLSDPNNQKVYPVLLGFLVVGIVFGLIARFRWLKRLSLVLEDRKTLLFLLGLLIAIYFYLCMNLTVYSVEENNLILKLWSMKSSVFVIVGEWLSLLLSIRMGQISAYRRKAQESREQMAKERLRELELRTIAATDPLTGCENRFQAGTRLKDALDTGCQFCLCFVDLNGLKAVNDGFGHEMGDKYLLAVAHSLAQLCRQGDYLFRYGGDEFVLLFFDAGVSQAAGFLRQAQLRLEEEQDSQAYPFSMSISYGIATPDDGPEAQDLIRAADTRMYQMKPSKRLSANDD